MNRIADRIDLAIDVLTLGQYGLEQEAPTDVACCGRIGHRAGWETCSPAPRRRERGACEKPVASGWDWPSRCPTAPSV